MTHTQGLDTLYTAILNPVSALSFTPTCVSTEPMHRHDATRNWNRYIPIQVAHIHCHRSLHILVSLTTARQRKPPHNARPPLSLSSTELYARPEK